MPWFEVLLAVASKAVRVLIDSNAMINRFLWQRILAKTGLTRSIRLKRTE